MLWLIIYLWIIYTTDANSGYEYAELKEVVVCKTIPM